MQQLSLQKEWPSAGMFGMSLALGVAIAAGIDAWSNSEEATAAELLASSAAALAIAAIMAVYGRLIRWKPFEQVTARAQPQGAAAPAVQRDRTSTLLSTMDIGILFLSTHERVSYCNQAFLRIWGIPSGQDLASAGLEQLLAVMGGTLARPGERSRFLLRAPPTDEAQVKLDLPMADGRLVTQQSHAVRDAKDVALGRMWVFEDVTVERRNAKQLVQLAERDALTGYYNRRRFNEELARMLADAQRNGTKLALLYFDVDGFKHVNDTFGHRAGDATLVRVANEMSRQVRRNEIFARLGGDEFAILAPEAADEDALKVMVERVIRSISQTRTEFDGQTLQVTCSCGIAVFPEDATTSEALVACADMALDEAKHAGRNTWRLFRSSNGSARLALVPLTPDARIRHALENNLLEVHYQGIFSARQHTLKHYEALLRVRDPDGPNGVLLTSEFIAIAEKSGRILEIDRWVLGQVIRKLADNADIPGLAVNISGRSLDDVELPAFIEKELRFYGVSPRRLLVELTETAAVSDLNDARRFIEALQALGCGVSLDDFGTGFSSFAYLKHLHVDSIKIDGMFIRDLERDQENQLFVRAIVSVAQGLHKTTIAECVESEASLKILASLGVDYVQGFHMQVPHVDPTGVVAQPDVPASSMRIVRR